MSNNSPDKPRATKAPGYLIEPLNTGSNAVWEGHHATNPCAIRLSADPRVFLGYRAGGAADYFRYAQHDVWGSHLGMAILDERGERVVQRFPLPIMTVETDFALPQSMEEYEAYMKGPNRDRLITAHDFRLWEDRGWLYLLYHLGSVARVFDCISRMKAADFLERIARSVELARRDADSIRNDWRELWWRPDVWQPCGVDGTVRIYASETAKNDIVFVRLNDGTLRMYHRPVPDIAVLDTGEDTFARATPDGIAALGCLQNCIRPGYTDNSHIGNNGAPIRVRIGSVEAFMDVVHGVHNERVTSPDPSGKWKLFYFPYLRLLDAETGECLYYSEEPLLDRDPVWREYVEEGTWVSSLAHLDGVIFTGGQAEAVAGCNGLDDFFHVYCGVGDTAVARASFRLRDVLPDAVIDDIQRRPHLKTIKPNDAETKSYHFPEPLSGWRWELVNNASDRTLALRRELYRDGCRESGVRPIPCRPGHFDADGLFFDGCAVRFVPDLGWIVLYRGIRYEGSVEVPISRVGVGVLLLDRENPERILYRSTEPVGEAFVVNGWTAAAGHGDMVRYLDKAGDLIPQAVTSEVRNIYEHIPMPSDTTKWLRRKAGLPVE
ncbi:MAG: hypothetical protein WCK47_06405 [bacterium]|nr:hypothetical protein [Candidatus Sumerlaeota bacterium]